MRDLARRRSATSSTDIASAGNIRACDSRVRLNTCMPNLFHAVSNSQLLPRLVYNNSQLPTTDHHSTCLLAKVNPVGSCLSLQTLRSAPRHASIVPTLPNPTLSYASLSSRSKTSLYVPNRSSTDVGKHSTMLKRSLPTINGLCRLRECVKHGPRKTIRLNSDQSALYAPVLNSLPSPVVSKIRSSMSMIGSSFDASGNAIHVGQTDEPRTMMSSCPGPEWDTTCFASRSCTSADTCRQQSFSCSKAGFGDCVS